MNLYSCTSKIYQIVVLTLALLITSPFDAFSTVRSVKFGILETPGAKMAAFQQRPTINPNLKLNNVQPRTGDLKLTLKADRDRVHVEEEVRFYVGPAEYVNNSPYDFIFNIGGNEIKFDNNQPHLVYRFGETGRYVVYVSVDVPNNDDVYVSRPAVTDSLMIQVDSVGLAVNPVKVEEGEPVNLRADFRSNGSEFQYRFFFGDGSPNSGWTSSPRITHTYPQRGTYQSFAEIGLSGGNQLKKLTQTITRNILVEPQEQQEPVVQALTLESDRTEVYTGEEIRLTVRPTEADLGTPYSILVHFGDGTTIEKERGTDAVTHHYHEPGSYRISASINSNPIFTNQNVVQLVVDNNVEIRVNSVPINVYPQQAETGKEITFETGYKNEDPQIRYRFYFGDSQIPSPWSENPTITYVYPDSGTYQVYAEIGRLSGNEVTPITSSVISTVTILENGFPWWLVYVLTALLVAAGFYKISNHTTETASVTEVQLKARIDPGNQNLESGKKPIINYHIRLNPNAGQGNYTVHTSKPDMIQRTRREKDE